MATECTEYEGALQQTREAMRSKLVCTDPHYPQLTQLEEKMQECKDALLKRVEVCMKLIIVA